MGGGGFVFDAVVLEVILGYNGNRNIGRELKMVELKEKIRELEEKLKEEKIIKTMLNEKFWKKYFMVYD
ncbi:MAG: hypothetical protein COU42_02945 [Candidatus Nealsonbacteria bacterium CG10_big_fil_rev_8_21_14_0_10_36_24]|uniref:Uncharacterized protein n=2 Tax=Candidatus Nealsoniibacteriota TaxID=1817911 RepID=A0A2H0YNF4_9BACT|nr:MAG: hypothetical protein COU42_02945 [Candidatus Nealsonbacteria bacterium CG10_big_fil_rev_8_21_14_0_10_36_24]PIS39990.1 MAG: hypothetical protein COT32_02135 [Candidatus Nealsonbacteria bacterium CG08_land_8_20_14_0_20_36_22]